MKSKLMLIVLALFATVTIAPGTKAGEIVFDEFIYLPMVLKPTADIEITYIIYNPSGSDVQGEYVTIENKDSSAQLMTGWLLHDNEDIHEFVFPEFTLEAGATVNVWTKSGTNTTTDLYWGLGSAIWNNGGDTAYLKDDANKLISACTYAGNGVDVVCNN